jgi:hypothetical protein
VPHYLETRTHKQGPFFGFIKAREGHEPEGRENEGEANETETGEEKPEKKPTYPSFAFVFRDKFTDERKQKKQRTSGRRITLGKEKRKKQRNRGQENKQRLYRGERKFWPATTPSSSSSSRPVLAATPVAPPSPRTDRRKGNPGHTERERPRKTGKNTAKQGKGRREEDRETRNPQTKAPASPTASSSPAPASKTRGRS